MDARTPSRCSSAKEPTSKLSTGYVEPLFINLVYKAELNFCGGRKK
jgi:hypothetical protein